MEILCFERAWLQPCRMIAQINVALAAEGRFAVEKIFPQGLKPSIYFAAFAARSKTPTKSIVFQLAI
jgi:hypothetical protein